MSPEAAPSTKRFGDYEILSMLGKGGMAEVYRAKALSGPHAGWPVAIKRLLPGLAKDPQAEAQFAHEAELSRTLVHPNIVRVLEVGSVSGISFIAMELVDGRDLGQILRRCQSRGIPLPVDFALYLGRVLLDALAYAHSASGPSGEPLGLVHCDVSPSNLFISRTGEIKLGDFGVARARVEASHGAELAGKPYYLSPEMLDGEVSFEADLWAATVTLFELLTLVRPFRGKSPEEVFAAIRSRAHPPLRTLREGLPEVIERVVEKGFSVDRGARFGSAAEFADVLGALYDERIGTPLAIAAVVRGLFGATAEIPKAVDRTG